MVLYVTRHGETNFNAQGRYAGSTDVPLNETGIKQARELAGRLSGMKFDVVVSSPMLRARQTADIVCAELGMEYIIYPQFAERNVGVYEGLT
jgi:broad specificity phosphatase PhoE